MRRVRETNLHESDLAGCQRCSANVRKHNITAEGYCTRCNGFDGLPIKCVGAWGREKMFTVSQYLGIFADAMNRKFNLNYLEICSGPGRCADRNGMELDGTPLVMLRHWTSHKFRSAVFVDSDIKAVDILNQRIKNLKVPIRAHACVGDYMDRATIDEAINMLGVDSNSLTLCVLDPYDCSMPFDVIRHIKNRLGRCDFIVSYFDGLDAKRNLPKAIKKMDCAELNRFARFFGVGEDRMKAFVSSEVVQSALSRSTTAELMELCFSLYVENLKGLGLEYCDVRPVRKGIDAGVGFYKLVFASASNIGYNFWQKIKDRTSTGQKQFSFMNDYECNL